MLIFRSVLKEKRTECTFLCLSSFIGYWTCWVMMPTCVVHVFLFKVLLPVYTVIYLFSVDLGNFQPGGIFLQWCFGCLTVWEYDLLINTMCVSAGCVLQVWLRTNSFHSHWQCMRALTAVSSPTLGVLLIFSSCHCNECSLILFNSVYPVTSILPDVPLETPFFILQTHSSLLYMLAFSISSHEPVLSKPPSL